ncbi:MAG TPA: winged helix-turn-helix domain-containing protein [Anaerolineae bacterium]|jgi:hypothetical protein
MAEFNPFFHRGPVRDPVYFFGRSQDIDYITGLLRAGQSVSLSGPRRMGKTSLAFHLARPEIAGAYGLEPESTRWVYLDGGMVDGLDLEWFYGALDRALGGEADAVPYAHFVERLRGLAGQNLRLLLVLDEFELIAANPRFGPVLFNHLRGLAAQFPLQFVTVSCEPLGELTFAHRETLSSPFFNIFAPTRLGLLSEAEAAELLNTLSTRHNQPFTLETVASLLELAGPQPLFLQIAGYRAFALAEAGLLSNQALATVRAQTQADLEAHLLYYWRNLDPAAQYALATLPLLDQAAPDYLAAAGLLHRGHYLGTALETFVRQQPVEGLQQAGPFLLDERRGLAAAYGQPIHLTPTLFAAFKLFLERLGQVVTPDDIEAILWPAEIAPDPERARGVVKKLRTALGPAATAIINRRGQGWLLEIGG